MSAKRNNVTAMNDLVVATSATGSGDTSGHHREHRQGSVKPWFGDHTAHATPSMVSEVATPAASHGMAQRHMLLAIGHGSETRFGSPEPGLTAKTCCCSG
ncbi:hypothetical protein CTA1_6834 [Colletotrichum tanaceti]|uniref:Uncharacterized protein n=1 Tax=Colletotrichum tanaceti TaxID=1306861 RepID=A0A4U6XCV5_9PEZI|nr:hypothetical protein CTA1_6834 [Colletotrichum tanaceti]